MGQIYFNITDPQDEMKVSIDLSALAPGFTTELGYLFEKGQLPQSYEMAMRLYQNAAKRGDAAAANNIGWLHLNGWSVPKDENAALAYFHQAAMAGSSTAMVNIGNLHEYRKEYRAALYWYSAAAEKGDVKGIFNCANMLFLGWGIRKNLEEAYAVFAALYERGYTDGTCFYLGYYAENGLISEKDPERARSFYQEGADAGDMYCCTNLGRMYALGLCGPADKAKAFAYYRKAGELGDALGDTNLAWMYETGDFVQKDLARAAGLYKKAAAAGEPHAAEAWKRIGDSPLQPKE